jgi:serine/threonine protein kinase
MEEPEFEDISEGAKDFISKLLIPDQSIRMSADEALRHPWLAEKHPLGSSTATKVNRSLKLTNVLSRLKWQKCTNVIMACSKFKKSLNSDQ